MTNRRRVLFLAEPATLAHVVRPIYLSQALDRKTYEVFFATGPDFADLVAGASLHNRELWSIGTKAYLAAVAAGRPVFPYSVLQKYVEEDLRHISAVQPDLVVGDFRLSLAISARLAGVPYVAISNAYWSPFARARLEVPVHAVTRIIGAGAANRVFQVLRPMIFAQHSLPMFRLCKKYGMPSLGLDLRRVFTEADLTLFADVPEVVPMVDHASAERYRYIGPVIWSPNVPLPESLSNSKDLRPLVYIALGSSGDPGMLQMIVDACIDEGCRVAVAVGSATSAVRPHPDVVTSPLFPGNEVATIADLVICNGGSPGAHQALAQATPVLGVPANLDQLLNMHFIAASGAGESLRADRLTRQRLIERIRRLLQDPEYKKAATRVAQWFSAYSAPYEFASAVKELLHRHRGTKELAGESS